MNIDSVVEKGAVQRIAVFRALHLGDLMCAVPALRALRAAYPDAEITLIGLPWARCFTSRFHRYLDRFIDFPGFPGLPERQADPTRIPEFLSAMQARRFDLFLQIHGSGAVTNQVAALVNPRHLVGFYLPGQYCPEPGLFLEYPDHEPEIRRHLRLMEFLSIPLHGEELEFPLTPADWEGYHHLAGAYGLRPGSYVCVHPGARARERRWPEENFAIAADRLAEYGFQIVLTGTENEAAVTAGVAQRMRAPAINLTGKTSLGTLGVLLHESRLLFCNDTGVSHLAAALKTPSIVLFASSDPKRWAPLNQDLHHIVAWAGALAPEAVLTTIDEVMGEEYSLAS